MSKGRRGGGGREGSGRGEREESRSLVINVKNLSNQVKLLEFSSLYETSDYTEEKKYIAVLRS